MKKDKILNERKKSHNIFGYMRATKTKHNAAPNPMRRHICIYKRLVWKTVCFQYFNFEQVIEKSAETDRQMDGWVETRTDGRYHTIIINMPRLKKNVYV